MEKIAVVYRSKSGFTKKYAQWIAKAVNGDLLVGNKVKVEDLLVYDTIVYGGALYVGGINGVKLITNNTEILKDKKLIIFTLGATPVHPEIVTEVKNINLTTEQQKQIQFFMLRGGFDFEKLTFIDKILMTLMKAKINAKKSSKKQLSADEIGMLASYSQPLDFTREKHIAPIVDAINAK